MAVRPRLRRLPGLSSTADASSVPIIAVQSSVSESDGRALSAELWQRTRLMLVNRAWARELTVNTELATGGWGPGSPLAHKKSGAGRPDEGPLA